MVEQDLLKTNEGQLSLVPPPPTVSRRTSDTTDLMADLHLLLHDLLGFVICVPKPQQHHQLTISPPSLFLPSSSSDSLLTPSQGVVLQTKPNQSQLKYASVLVEKRVENEPHLLEIVDGELSGKEGEGELDCFVSLPLRLPCVM